MPRRKTAAQRNKPPSARVAPPQDPAKTAVAPAPEALPRISEGEALQQSEERFRSVVTAMTEGLVLQNADGTIIDCNPQAARILGRTRDQLLGKTSHDSSWNAVREDGRPFPGAEHPAMITLRTGQPCRNVMMGLPLAGSDFRWININAEPLFQDGQHKPCGTVVTFADITERKRAEEGLRASECKYRRLHESITDAFVSVAMTGQILEFNAAYRKMLGYADEELLRLTYADVTPEKWHAFEAAIVQQQILPRGCSDVYEKEYRRKDGTIFPVELRTFLMKDEAGRPTAMWAIIRDITERKQTEAALRKSEERFRAITDLSPDIISIFDREGRLLFNSAAAGRIHGYQAGELESRSTFDFIHPDDRPGVADAFGHLFQAPDEAVNVQYRYRNADGSYKWMEAFGRNELANPHINGIIAISRDITERKRAEVTLCRAHAELEQRVLERTAELHQTNIALRKSEARFRAVASHTPDHILIQDLNLRYQLVINPQLGLTEAQMLGKTDLDLFRKEDAEHLTRVKKKVLATGKPLHLETSLPNLQGEMECFEGDYIPKLDPTGKVEGLIGYFRNTTERKRADEALRKQAKILEWAHVLIRDVASRIVTWNKGVERFYGWPEAEALGKVSHVLFRTCFPISRSDYEKKLLKHGEWEGELRHVKRDGTEVIVASHHVLHRDSTGKAMAILEVNNDITERHQVEEALRKSEERYRVLFTSSRDALMTLEPPAWKFTSSNPTAVEMFRAGDVNRLLATAPWELSPEFQPDGRPSRRAAQAMIETAMRQGSHLFEWRQRRLDGEEFPASVLLTRVELEGRPFLQATVRDITERVRLEQEILNISERERRRIAQDLHDGLGQLLVGANYLTSTLRKELAGKSVQEARRLDRIQEVINEAIAQTRSLARGVQPVEPEPNGLMVALEKLAKQTQELFRVRCDFKLSRPVMLKDNKLATHLFRIAQEAVTNAVKHGKPKRILIRLTQTRDAIGLSVKDNGTGMAAGRRPKSGMGLSIMRHRASLVGGVLCVRASAKGGTSVVCRVQLFDANNPRQRQSTNVKKDGHGKR